MTTPQVRSGAATKAAPPASADGDAKDGGAEKKRRKFYKPKVKKDGAEDAKVPFCAAVDVARVADSTGTWQPKYRDRAAERREAGDVSARQRRRGVCVGIDADGHFCRRKRIRCST